MPTLTLNGKNVSFEPGWTILEAAKSAGVDIPTLCHLQAADHKGVCRVCVVEARGSDRLLPACATPAVEGMELWTDSPAVIEERKLIVELLLAEGDHNCLCCEANGDCVLQRLAYAHGVKNAPVANPLATRLVDDSQAFIFRDFKKCVMCGRCVAACNEIQVNLAIPLPFGRREDRPSPAGWLPLVDHERCTQCGECVQACPVGALTEKGAKGRGRSWELTKVRTTCPHCGVGCQQWLHVKDDQIVKVTAVEDARPNLGMLCVKGRFGHDFVGAAERLTTPLIKENGDFRPADWDEALDLVAGRLAAIKAAHGPEAFCGVADAGGVNEDAYNMQKFFRAALGSNNVDHRGRACLAPQARGPAAARGSGAMTNSFAELEKAKLILVIGADVTEDHPVAGAYIKRAARRGARLIVADQRRTGLVEHASLHAPVKTGAEVAFVNGLMRVLMEEGLYDKDQALKRAADFEKLRRTVERYNPEMVAALTGVGPELLVELARALATTKPAMLVHALGPDEGARGLDKALAYADLQLLLGNVGREGGGVNLLRGRGNAQGLADMGVMPGFYPGYQGVEDDAARAKFEKAWGVELNPKTGLALPAMFEAMAKGAVKAMWICGEDLVAAAPDGQHVARRLGALDFLVCGDILPTATTRLADVVFPLAAWGESDGVFTNSERRISRARKAVDPPGQAKPGWWILREVARRMGHDWPSQGSREIWDNELSVLVPALAGVTYDRLEGDGLQWPCPGPAHPGSAYLSADACPGPDAFHAVEWAPPADEPDGR